MEKKSESIFKPAIILLVITAVVALLLGLVNYITADKISAINAEKTASAMSEVFPATSYCEISAEGAEGVAAAYSAIENGVEVGYVVEVTPTGFGGAIDMMVGVDESGNVTGVSIISMSETSGLGANASKDSFRQQFIGASGSVAVTKDGGEIDSLTGATITSRAVAKGVNYALDFCAALNR